MQKSTAALFVAALYLPILAMIFDWAPPPSLNENRTLAAFPSFPHSAAQARTYTDNLMAFYRDHFGFRDPLIHQLMKVKLDLLHTTGVPNVLLGRDGWLFFRLTDDPDLPPYKPLAPFDPSQLGAWRRALENRAASLARRHIAYLLVIAPEKQTIYPEFLTPQLQPLQAEPRLAQLIDALNRTRSPVNLLDLRPTLLAAKQAQSVYWQADSHWTPFGYFVVYQTLMHKIQQLLPRKSLYVLRENDFTRFQALGQGGDLANLLGVPEMFQQQVTMFNPPPIPMPYRDKFQQLYETNGLPHMPRLLMLHDSFGYRMIPLIAPSFSHGAYFWGNHRLNNSLIDAEKPDLVIDEFAERFLTLELSNGFEFPVEN